MACQTEQLVEPQPSIDEAGDSLTEQIRIWMRSQLPWWTMSFTIHVVALASLLLVGKFAVPAVLDNEIPTFTPPEMVAENDTKVQPFDVGPPDVTPRPIDLTAPPMIPGSQLPDAVEPDTSLPGDPGGDDKGNPSPIGTPGGIGFVGPDTFGPGAKTTRYSPHGDPGNSNSKNPYDNRPQIGKHIIGRIDGGSRDCERAVTAAIYWFAHHQSRDGSWSLQEYVKLCKDKSCTGIGGQESLAAATAMGVLPFLGAGQTNLSPGPFQPTVSRAIYWLVGHQKPDGDLSAGASQQMYSHALATIALCEDYGMSRDRTVGAAAQRAINFIQAAQNSKTGGWRYHPGDEGDTSVSGWQLMALKSGQMAKLNVNPAAFDGVKRWLMMVAKDAPGGNSSGGSGQFSYQPEGSPTPTMSAVGLLCSQYMHAGRADATIVGGVKYLMANLPERDSPNVYYWYYATQVMHNMDDRDWDTWNRRTRKILVESQQRDGCAAGSWDPDKPVRDAWGVQGGRVMMTSLSALTLEVYYRYLPLYKLDKPESVDLPATK